MDFLELASERYSVRSFSSRKVEDEKIDLILQAAKVAPTAVNFQPERLYVVKSEEGIQKLSAMLHSISLRMRFLWQSWPSATRRKTASLPIGIPSGKKARIFENNKE